MFISDPSPINHLSAGPLAKFYRGDNLVASLNGYGAGNSWPKGHYTEGPEIINQLLDVVRMEAERAESLQGFQFVHSLGGGTGSGMGTLLLSKLREEFADKIMWTWSVTETAVGDSCVVRPYNVMLSMMQLIENADVVVYLDDDMAYKACFNNRINKPVYSHLNNITARIMSNITCPMRLPSSESMNLRKISSNLVPYGRQHFLTVGTAPITAELIDQSNGTSLTPVTLADISSQLFEPQNMMMSTGPENTAWKHLAAMCSFRGAIQTAEIAELINLTRDKYASKFATWIPDNLKWTRCDTAAPGVNMSGTYLANSTAILHVLQRLDQHFTALFRRKAFLFHYANDGLDEIELTEAQCNVQDLITEYQNLQGATNETKFDENFKSSEDEVE